MTKDTNKEQVTLAEAPANEIASPSSESNPAQPLDKQDEQPAEEIAKVQAEKAPEEQVEEAAEVQAEEVAKEQNEEASEELNNEPAEAQAEEQNEAQNETVAEVENQEPSTAPAPPRKRVAWYDILMFVLFFLSSQLLGAFIAIKLGVLPANTSLFSSSDFEVIELAESTQARFVAISLLFAMLLCFLMLRIYRAIRNWDLRPSFKSPGWASPIRVLCGYILMWCISIAIEPLTSILPDSQSYIGSGGWLLVSAVLIAPIFEEYLFRGYIAGTIQYAYGSVAAWLISAILFGVAHGQPAVMVSATMSGLVLGFYFLRSRSVMIPMILHAMNNLTVCFLQTFDAGELTFRQLIANDSTYWTVQIICSVVSLVVLTRMFFIIRGQKNDKYL